MASRVHAVAVEIADDSVRMWNEELAHASAKLGTLQGDKLKAVSLSASHTNFALRLLAQEVEHESDLVSVQGKRRACNSGIALSTRQPCTDWSGGMPRSAAGSTNSKWFGGCTRCGCRRMPLGMSTLASSRSGHWHRSLGAQRACHTFTPLPSSAQGGARRCSCRRRTSSRMLGPDIWEILSQDARGPAQNVLFRHALVKLAYIRDTLTAQEARKAFTKAVWGKASEADVIMQEWRRILREQCDGSWQPWAMRMLRWVPWCKYETMQGMAHGFVTMLRTIAGNAAIRSPWEEFEEACPASSSASQPSKDKQIMRELNTDGSVKPHEDRLLEAGFEMGQSVRRKPDMLEGKLVGLKDGKVRVELIENGLVAKILIDDFLSGAWHTPRAQPQLIENPAKYHPSRFPEWLAFNMKARAGTEPLRQAQHPSQAKQARAVQVSHPKAQAHVGSCVPQLAPQGPTNFCGIFFPALVGIFIRSIFRSALEWFKVGLGRD